MVVYVDVLVIVNLFVNYALLLCSSLIMKRRISNLRLLLGALTGSVYGLVIFLPNMSAAVELLLRLAASGLIVLASFGYKGFRSFIRCFLSFFAVAFAFGGIMLTLWVTVAPVGMIYNNGAVYFDIDLPVLAVSTVVCFTVVSLISRFTARRAPVNSVYTLTVSYNGKSTSGTALCDTGNSLKESFSGLPVIIGEYEGLSAVMPEAVKNYYENPAKLSATGEIRMIICKTVSGSGILPSFKPDEIQIKSLSRCIKTSEVYIAVTKNRLAGGEFDFILNSEIFNGDNEYEDFRADKKGVASPKTKQHNSLRKRPRNIARTAFQGGGAGGYRGNSERQQLGEGKADCP